VRIRSLLIAALSCWLPLAAHALPVTYDFVFGVATANLLANGVPVGSATADMTGTFATFDDAVPELVDFQFVIDDPSVTLGPLGTMDVLLTASGAPGFSAPATPISGGRYAWVGNLVDVVGSISFTGGIFNGQTLPVSLTLSNVDGQFRTGSLADETFGFTDAIDVFTFMNAGVQYKLVVHAAWKGVPVVPEPATAGLLALGLAGLARRRPAA
jgi:hypothetical protein